MQHRSKVITGAIAVAVAIVSFVVMNAPAAAMTKAIGYWAYPVSFGLNMLLSGIVLVVFMPSRRKGIEWTWMRKKIEAIQAKLASDNWAKILRRGTFICVLLITLSPAGPIGGAIALRMLGQRGDRAWAYAFFANLIASFVWISAYLGLFGAVKSALSALFAP